METSDEQRQVLMDAIGFDQSDLEANRAGTMTSHQQQAFWQRIRLDAIGAVVVIAFGLLVSQTSTGSQFFGLIIVVGLIAVGYDASKFVLDLRSSSVERADGNVSLNRELQPATLATPAQPGLPPNRSARYKITVELQSFDVTESLYRALQDNREYAVYYTPYSRKILSAEGPRTYDTTTRLP